jgi:N-acetylmuramoyl-L-alanine amidase
MVGVSLAEVMTAIALMLDTGTTYLDPSEVICLSQNVYHEARGESLPGQLAVAYVTLNRVEDDRWGSTICDVVSQPKQFSWTAGEAPKSVTEPHAYETAVVVALMAMTGLTGDPTQSATHYYAHDKVTPSWSKRFDVTTVIGSHTFQR